MQCLYTIGFQICGSCNKFSSIEFGSIWRRSGGQRRPMSVLGRSWKRVGERLAPTYCVVILVSSHTTPWRLSTRCPFFSGTRRKTNSKYASGLLVDIVSVKLPRRPWRVKVLARLRHHHRFDLSCVYIWVRKMVASYVSMKALRSLLKRTL